MNTSVLSTPSGEITDKEITYLKTVLARDFDVSGLSCADVLKLSNQYLTEFKQESYPNQYGFLIFKAILDKARMPFEMLQGSYTTVH